MRIPIAICIAGLFAASTPSFAQPVNEYGYLTGPKPGCYQRVWNAQELAKSPGQVIEGLRIRVFVTDEKTGAIRMRIIMKAANQGLARDTGVAGLYFADELECGPGYREQFPFCYAYCDGGRMTFPKMSEEALVIQVEQLKLRYQWGDCQKAFDIVGGRNEKLSYRVDRAPDSVCSEM